ncbi:hypothetical protein EVAR_45876_1 [Eumeta japonica]|uniref:Uncharacterized protein n=1 Tax=Eumeta variegata TaxID=151549 RepID=A0A4C1WKP5_EUMVA|nr:hypothetical protein EVAR_45876_1 [Eumeta japonica]
MRRPLTAAARPSSVFYGSGRLTDFVGRSGPVDFMSRFDFSVCLIRTFKPNVEHDRVGSLVGPLVGPATPLTPGSGGRKPNDQPLSNSEIN